MPNQNLQTPKITDFEKSIFVGVKLKMSFSRNCTAQLWKNFMPRQQEVKHRANSNYYSVEIYNNPHFFESFDPSQKFEKWAALKVDKIKELPEGMEMLEIPEGSYAVFQYNGKSSDAEEAYNYIFNTWIPQSGCTLDDRPHFAIMDKNYRKDEINSEEIWIPVVS